MPRAPGSSQRCEQCRQKRKRCDLTVPQCLRCQRQGLQCTGPRLSPIFVHRHAEGYNQQSHRAALHKALQQHSRSRSSRADNTIRPAHAMFQSHDPNSLLTVPRIDNSLYSTSLRTFYRSIRVEFLPKPETGLFSGDRVRLQPPIYSSVALCIRALLAAVNSPIQVLDTAILALLSSYHGWLRSNKQMTEFAKSCYTTALARFRRHISVTHSASSSPEVFVMRQQGNLLSSIALQLFEDVNNVDYLAPGYLAHVDGCLSILKLLGPHAFDRLEMQLALNGLRGMLTYVALDRRQSMLLAAPEWLNLPSSSFEQTWRDHLFDIAIHIPGLLEKIDVFAASCTACSSCQSSESRHAQLPSSARIRADYTALAHARSLLHECSVHRARLDNWLSALKVLHKGPIHWYKEEDSRWGLERDTSLIDDQCTPVFAGDFYRLRFAIGQEASVLMNYWAIRLELLTGIRDVHNSMAIIRRRLAETETDRLDAQAEYGVDLEWQTAQDEKQIRELAQLILQATAYSTTCFEGVTASRGPLRVVARYLHNHVGSAADDLNHDFGSSQTHYANQW